MSNTAGKYANKKMREENTIPKSALFLSFIIQYSRFVVKEYIQKYKTARCKIPPYFVFFCAKVFWKGCGETFFSKKVPPHHS